jgi:cytochrome c553
MDRRLCPAILSTRSSEAVCGVARGVDGLAKIAGRRTLAGQSESCLIEQIAAFKSANRDNEMTSVVVQDL